MKGIVTRIIISGGAWCFGILGMGVVTRCWSAETAIRSAEQNFNDRETRDGVGGLSTAACRLSDATKATFDESVILRIRALRARGSRRLAEGEIRAAGARLAATNIRTIPSDASGREATKADAFPGRAATV